MAIMAMGMKVKQAAFILSGFSIAFASVAGDWKLNTSVKIDESYSDNIELSPNNKKSSLVSQLGLNLAADYQAQNASLNLSSSNTQAWYSHNHDLDQSYNNISADGKMLLWPNGLTFTASASVANQARNSSRNALAGIVSADVIQTEQYQTGLEYDIKNSRYSLSTRAAFQVNKSEDRIGENKGSSFSLTSANGNAARHIFWDISGKYSERENETRNSEQHVTELKIGLITNYNILPFIRYYSEDNSGSINRRNNLETNSYGFGFRWQPINRLILDASYNHPIDDTIDDSVAGLDQEQEPYYDVLLNWQPSIRTKIQASYTQRFFGDSYGLNLQHGSRRLTNTISYDESVQSFTRNNFQVVSSTFLCQNPNAVELADCFIQTAGTFDPQDLTFFTIESLELFEDNDYWLNKRFSWSSVLTLPRTKFSLKVTSSDRQNLNSDINNTIKSISLSADRKITPSAAIVFKASYDERSYGQLINNLNDQIDKYNRYSANFNKKLNKSLKFNLDLEHTKRTSNQVRFNYSENRLSLGLTKDF